MNDQEKQIISDIFKRLEQTAGQSRDGDAERFINDKVRTQPYAPYAMAQALYVQEEAMKSLNQQLEQARVENEQLQHQVHQAGQNQGGFLSSIFGGGQRQAPPPPQGFGRSGPPPGYGQGGPQGYAPQQGGPWGGPQAQGGQPQGGPQGGPWAGQPQAQQQAPQQGGGFLRGALTTAAGVAGGMVVGNALMNAFSGSGGGHSTLGNLSQSDMASMGMPQGAEGAGFQEASFGDGGSSWGGGNDAGGFQEASFGDGGSSWGGGGNDAGFQDASYDDGGSDFGGGDDGWA
ncbi:DUF2076 domain-containing protein [Enterovirga rhinocerotis]|uniref:DUF2076 family protein n=1 Tax=Enterovirga rhinocerotis TaxID=1339210 RepID=A0A4R7BRQ9_9HYPH|nr:DUF2076 domain-containing protein [Enterovirga rhinocerotis]TDR87145.1 hypothetical protein EV668_4225 [Enterovirga rhinocerotis]